MTSKSSTTSPVVRVAIDIAKLSHQVLLLIYFSDGSIMGIDTGSNAANLRDKPSQPDDFHVDFRMHWVPPAVTK